MAGGLTVSVRQVASYPTLTPTTLTANDLLLVQSAGLGGPYSSVSAGTLVSSALLNGPALGVGNAVPADSGADVIYTDAMVNRDSGGLLWNTYYSTTLNAFVQYDQGLPGAFTYAGVTGFLWALAAAGGGIGQPIGAFFDVMKLTPAGALVLPLGTLTVARDPNSALEVATMGWVGRSTVASFNGRRGVVTLSANDIACALGYPTECIATIPQVNEAICAAIQDLLKTYPAVWSWNGRVGDVWLTVHDMNWATMQQGALALEVPTPPATSNDNTVPDTQWVVGYVTQTAGFAAQEWVIQYVAANAVTSFNGRQGTVNLTLQDIQGAGGAPIASPNFSGVPSAPTAAPGSNTGQIATTAFVQAAISGATAGVASFNGRTGIVVLTLPDVTGVGGAPINNPAFTGQPAAPTPPPGDASARLATTAFVAAAITAAGGVTSFNTRSGAITLTLGDVTGAGGAPLGSPALTGTPTAPTAATGTNDSQIATTAFVNAAISSIGIGVTSFEGRTGAVTLQANDISAAGGLINPSVALTGTPTAPTATAGNSSTQIATTAFVNTALLGTVTTFNGRAGAVTLAATDITGAGGALLAGPAFTGVPTAPTAATGTNTTQLATTGFVTAALTTQAANSVTSFNGRQGVVTLTTADITGAGGAPIASPTFTGTPAVPTATAGTSTTQAASTAFVMNAIASSTAGVTSFNSRTGAVTLQANDVSAVGGALLASPQFTGTPTAPTPASGNNSTDIATTAFVMSALSTAAVTSFNGRSGAVTLTTADITGAGGATAAQLANYLPLTGGTLTGALTVASGTAVGTLYLNGSTNGSFFVGGTTAAPFAAVSATASLLGLTNGAGVTISTINLNALTVQFQSGGVASIVSNGIVFAGAGATQASAIFWNGTTYDAYTNGAHIGAIQFQSSDEALKENFAPISVDPLGVLNQVTLQQFDWIPNPVFTVQRPHWSCGFTAQDIGGLIPEAQTGSPGNLGVDLMPVVAYCVGAIQKLVAMIEQLQGAVGALQQNANVSQTAWEAV